MEVSCSRPDTERHGARSGGAATARGEGGFALLTVLLVLIGVTALASAGFILSDSDYRVSQNHRSSVHAFLSANGGLYEYIGDRRNADSMLTYTYTTGQASVEGEQLLDLGNDLTLHRITSESQYQPPEGGVSSRTVSAAVLHWTGEIEVPAAILTLTALHKNGGSGTITGGDQAASGDCDFAPADSVAGVAVPPGGYDQNGGSMVPAGDPDTLALPLPDLIDLIGFDWEAIVNDELLIPDYTIPPDSWPSIGAGEWPLIQVKGDITVSPSMSGQGALIVEGSLTMNGSWDWDGIVLVGDNFTTNGNSTVDGAILAGLNVILGQSPPDSDLGNGTKNFRFNSCNIMQASEAAFGGLFEIPGTWSESM